MIVFGDKKSNTLPFCPPKQDLIASHRIITDSMVQMMSEMTCTVTSSSLLALRLATNKPPSYVEFSSLFENLFFSVNTALLLFFVALFTYLIVGQGREKKRVGGRKKHSKKARANSSKKKKKKKKKKI
jgi:hypothetical protein